MAGGFGQENVGQKNGVAAFVCGHRPKYSVSLAAPIAWIFLPAMFLPEVSSLGWQVWGTHSHHSHWESKSPNPHLAATGNRDRIWAWD